MGDELLNNFASIECTRLKKGYFGIGSLKMRLISYIDIVYGRIFFENVLIIDNEAH